MDGCISLILGEEDREARRKCEASVEYALKLIGSAAPAGGGVRVYEAAVELSEQGSRLTSLHEKKPAPGEEKLAIDEYHRALICVGCFGTPSQMRVIATLPEEAYRSPAVQASADHWAYVRAMRPVMRGDETDARREASMALTKASGSGKSEAAALLAVLEGDADKLNRGLQEALKLRVKATSKQHNDPLTVVFLSGLALCRLALDRGLQVEDSPCLPVRVLPSAARAYCAREAAAVEP